MKSNRVNYLLIIIGGVMAIYTQATEKQDIVILIFGIAILMIGIYGVASKIPSKFDKEVDDSDEDNEV